MSYWRTGHIEALRDREFPFAVDIPIPRRGNSHQLPAIHAAAKGCVGQAQYWAHSTPLHGELRQWWTRIGTQYAGDAERVAVVLSALQARRVR